MKPEFSWQVFEKSSNIKFYENSSSGSRVVPCGDRQADGRTDRHEELIDAFRNFAKASKNNRPSQAGAKQKIHLGGGRYPGLSVLVYMVQLSQYFLISEEHSHSVLCECRVQSFPCTQLDDIQDLPLNKLEVNFISFRCLDALDLIWVLYNVSLYILSVQHMDIVTVYLQCTLSFTTEEVKY
jgi:hypothetical protein